MFDLTTITDFISRNWISLAIICTFSYLFAYVVRWYGKINFREGLILFMQGIIVIMIMYFLQWSIQSASSGAGKDINFLLFQVEVSGKNFLNSFQNDVRELTQGSARNYSGEVLISKILPAFLEEFFKFLMLIFFLRNTTKYILAAVIGLLGANIIMGGAFEASALVQWSILGSIIGTIWIFFGHEKQLLGSVNHGIYALAIIAAGFAFGENIKYLIEHEQRIVENVSLLRGRTSLDYLTQLSFLRSIFGNVSHILFSGIVGYFFARGFFGGFDLIDAHKTKKATTWLRFLGVKGFIRLYIVRMTVYGLLISTIVHAVYNYFMSGERFGMFGGFGGVVVTLVIGVMMFEMYVLREQRYVTNYGGIQNQIQRGKQLREIRHN